VPVLNCLCGARIEAAGVDELIEAFRAHGTQAHPQIRISDSRWREVEASIRHSGGWSGAPVAIEGEVEVRRLTAESRDDYLAYFDREAFADNPAWAACYCMAYCLDVSPDDFMGRGGDENRADRAAMIERGEASGVLAYAGGRVVGWCHAAPRTSLKLLDRTPEFAAEEPDATGAIVCYVIAPSYRGQGLARKLLDCACEMLRERGLRWVHAYPPMSAAGAAGSYHGRMSMYVGAGFEQVREAGHYVVMRKAL
jgi:ribosomal protein S18 acetylase RimI-like enzyme